MVEWQLHNAQRTAERCREAVQDALDRAAPSGGMGLAVQSGPGDRTARAGLMLLERDQALENAEKWLVCIRETSEHFKGSLTGQIAEAYYGKRVTVLQVAEALNYEKQTINRYRDRFVTFLALLAANRGLIDMEMVLAAEPRGDDRKWQRKQSRNLNRLIGRE
jgi:hypothetical protein